MKILYLGNWSAQDGLSVSTIRPHLQILSALSEVECIYYVSIERNEIDNKAMWEIDNVKFRPYLFSKATNLFGQLKHLILLPLFLKKIIRQNKIDHIVCRSSPAGSYGFLTYLITGIDYSVESFEPHSKYMLHNKVWKKNSLRYRLQSFFEKKQMNTANALITVSQNYFDFLRNHSKVKGELFYAPCAINQAQFEYRLSDREEIRTNLQISLDAVVGIYVGKFGDIYYGTEAVSLFSQLKSLIRDFHLILLSNDQSGQITKELIAAGFAPEQFSIRFTKPSDVTKYLSASDFAISLVRPTDSSIYCSPVKHGEYWANGLPIILDKNIGDDSDIIEKSGNGIVTDLLQVWSEPLIHNFLEVIELSLDTRENSPAKQLALKYRSFDNIRDAYQKLFDKQKIKLTKR